jgi:processive 1,2-diacylglycerol beta-glucosyltransferase
MLGARLTGRTTLNAVPPRVLIFTAGVGEGHDLPARVLADGLHREDPSVETSIVDALPVMGPLLERVAEDAMRTTFGVGRMGWAFDLQYLLFARLAPTRRIGQALLHRVAGPRVSRFVAAHAPDIVVSTYPVVTDVLGDLRARRLLDVPAVSAVTDLASLWYWAHPGIDVHLLTHPESLAEVRGIAGDGAAYAVNGLNDPRFLAPPSRDDARAALALTGDGAVVAVSGGGWAVGDLAGAVRVARTLPATVLVLCARNERTRERLRDAFADDPAVRVLGFVDDMPTLLAATDALVHSTAGLTVLEAIMVGCRPISYGWGIGHIRGNNRAFARFGIAEVATTAEELRASLRRAVAAPRAPRYEEFAALPAAADVVLGLARS